MTVSVLIPAYNAEAMIERSLLSVLNQSARPHEVIVVDDGSTDATAQIVARLARETPSLKLIRLQVNGGPSRARNAGIEVATGDWIAIHDADDAFKPRRLELLERLGEEKGADFVADNFVFYDHALQREGRLGFYVDWEVRKISAEDLFRTSIPEEAEFSYGLLQPLIRREFLMRTGLRYDEAVRYTEDFQFYAELFFNGAEAWVSREPGYIYTTRVGEFSNQPSQYSQSIPRYDVAAAINDAIALKYAAQIDGRFAQIVRRRGKRLRAVHLANVARELRRSKRYVGYASMVLGQPDLLELLLLRTWRRTSRRLGGSHPPPSAAQSIVSEGGG